MRIPVFIAKQAVLSALTPFWIVYGAWTVVVALVTLARRLRWTLKLVRGNLRCPAPTCLVLPAHPVARMGRRGVGMRNARASSCRRNPPHESRRDLNEEPLLDVAGPGSANDPDGEGPDVPTRMGTEAPSSGIG